MLVVMEAVWEESEGRSRIRRERMRGNGEWRSGMNEKQEENEFKRYEDEVWRMRSRKMRV